MWLASVGDGARPSTEPTCLKMMVLAPCYLGVGGVCIHCTPILPVKFLWARCDTQVRRNFWMNQSLPKVVLGWELVYICCPLHGTLPRCSRLGRPRLGPGQRRIDRLPWCPSAAQHRRLWFFSCALPGRERYRQ